MTSFRARFLAALCLSLCVPRVVSGQVPLTIERAVQETVTNNPALRAARAGAAQAGAGMSEARAGWFPRLSVSESWQRGDQPVFVFSALLASRRFAASNFAIAALNHPDPLGFFHTSIGLDQTVFDGGRQRAAVRRATLRHDVSSLVVDQTAADLALQATEAFGRIIVAEATGRAAAAGLQAAREDHTRAERRRDSGMATDADVLALAAHIADLQQRAIASQGDAEVARAELNRLMGAPIDQMYEVVEPSAAADDPDVTTPLSALLAEADRARPELRRAAVAGQLADAERAAARSALVPQVAAQAGFDISGTQIADRASSWLVGAEVRWNLSLGGAELAALKAAADGRARAAAEADDARAAVHVEVISARSRLLSARARQAAGRAAVDQARESQRIIRDRFDAGVAGVADVLRASTAVLDAEAQRAAAVVDALTSAAMLKRALGRRP